METSATDYPSLEIWSSFKKGNKDAFEAIYHLYFDELYRYGIRLLADEDSVKDCIHDLFLKLWNNKKNLGDVKEIKSYLIISLRGIIYNKLQRNKIDLFTTEEFENESKFSLSFYPNDSTDASSKKAIIITALNKLSPRQKEIIYLRYFLDFDYEDIAQIMGISVKGAYKLNARSIKALRDLMDIDHSALLIVLLYAAQHVLLK